MTAIPISAVDAQVRRLYEIAQEYRANGYDVVVGPSQRELPEFLRGFEPDLVVTSEDDRAVVEVKQRRSLIGAEWFSRMAQSIEEQPGWRLELVLVPAEGEAEEAEELLPDAGNIIRVHTLLSQARELGHDSMAIVAAFAAAENAMLLAANRAGLPLSSRSPDAMMKTLFAHGLLSKEAYDDLDRAMHVRNEVVHGKRTDVDGRPWAERIAPIADELVVPSA